MRTVIIDPELSKYQISGTRRDATVELHKVTMHDGSMMLMERVDGGHEGHPIRKSPTNPEPSEMDYKIVGDRVLPSSLELKSTRNQSIMMGLSCSI